MATNRLQGHTGVTKSGTGALFRSGSPNKVSQKPGLTKDLRQMRREHRLRFFGDSELGETRRAVGDAVSKLSKYSKGLSYKQVRRLKEHSYNLKKYGFKDASGKKVYFSAADKKVFDAVVDSYSISGNKSDNTAKPAPESKGPTQRAVNFVTDDIRGVAGQNATKISNPILAAAKIKEADLSDELLKQLSRLSQNESDFASESDQQTNRPIENKTQNPLPSQQLNQTSKLTPNTKKPQNQLEDIDFD
ncbi:MAG: hypothetical protein WC508_01660 [Patescibacteria group bacterium]